MWRSSEKKWLRCNKRTVFLCDFNTAHHSDEATDEAKVREVVGVYGGCWVDLQTVVVLASILKQAVHGIQDFMGQQEEPLPVEEEKRT